MGTSWSSVNAFAFRVFFFLPFFSVKSSPDYLPSTSLCHMLEGYPGLDRTSFHCWCSESWVAVKPRPIFPKHLFFRRWFCPMTVHVTESPSRRFWTLETWNENASLNTGLAFHRFVLVLNVIVFTSPPQIWLTSTLTSVSVKVWTNIFFVRQKSCKNHFGSIYMICATDESTPQLPSPHPSYPY